MIMASADGGRAREVGRHYPQGVVDVALDAAVLVILAGLFFAATLALGRVRPRRRSGRRSLRRLDDRPLPAGPRLRRAESRHGRAGNACSIR